MSLYFVSGFLTNFISAPVISAFTSAVSINVMTSQVKGLLGLKKVILSQLSFCLYIYIYKPKTEKSTLKSVKYLEFDRSLDEDSLIRGKPYLEIFLRFVQ